MKDWGESIKKGAGYRAKTYARVIVLILQFQYFSMFLDNVLLVDKRRNGLFKFSICLTFASCSWFSIRPVFF